MVENTDSKTGPLVSVLIPARNEADTAIYAAEKALKELGDKVEASEKASVEENIEKVKKAMEGSDVAAIKSSVEELSQSMQSIGEKIYQQAAAAAGATPPPEAGPAPEPGPEARFSPGGRPAPAVQLSRDGRTTAVRACEDCGVISVG